MRVLLSSTSGAGHLGPLIPFAHALRRAGHETLVTAPVSAQARVERAGLPFMSFADPPERELGPLWARVGAATPEEANDIGVGELRGWAGLAPDPAGDRLAGAPYLTLVPETLEVPGGPAEALRFRAAPAPWQAVRAPGERPLVYVSFGSVAPTMGFYPGLYRAVIDALAELPIRLVVTVGDAADPAELGPLPAHVRAERWIPQAEMLTVADAVVGHGGFGTTLGALLAGVPQAVVPLFADQPYNARRIAELGAGLAVDAQDPAAVGAAVARLLEEPAFGMAAGRVALEAQALPSIDAAPAVLEALVLDAAEPLAA